MVTVAKLEFKWVIRGSFLFSALINIGHGWQYQAVDSQESILSSIYGDIYYKINGYSCSDYPEGNQGTPYLIFSIEYFCISFCIFFFLNTGLEVKIVRRMQKELKEKRERLAKMNAEKLASTKNSNESGIESKTEIEEKKREEEDAKKERKVIKMVIINGILNFVFRAPEMVFWLENAKIMVILPVVFSHYAGVPGIFSLISIRHWLSWLHFDIQLNFFYFLQLQQEF
jgi:hypothetical protein